VIDAALDRFGRVDTLINNAGIFIPGPFHKYTEQNYRDLLATNLAGFFFHPARHRGNAEAGERPYRSDCDHPRRICEFKRASSASVADEGRSDRRYARARYRIRLPWHSGKCFGARHVHAPETHEAVALLHPLKRMGEPEDIAQAILYLEDASFVTGEILHVDGAKSQVTDLPGANTDSRELHRSRSFREMGGLEFEEPAAPLQCRPKNLRKSAQTKREFQS
jgi:short chain dehydrogenase/Enoyl-(Acyl carrier protein) reductase